MNTGNEAVVRKFCDAFGRKNLDELLSFFAPDAVYHNVPLEPVRGLNAIRSTFEMFVAPADRVEFEILHMASTDDVVLNERIDRFVIAGRQVTLPVAGVFIVRDGKISAWRDYFDMQTYLRQTGTA
jgi:limonene-1,2-epoxide hydrolase